MSKSEAQKNFERLFLLEFLVDHVVIYNSKLELDQETISALGPVIVKFQFLTYPPIEIREEDFTPSTKPLVEEKRILLKSGRSCMFSLSSNKSQKICDTDFDVFINVSRKKRSNIPGNFGGGEDAEGNIFIGATKINMNDSLKDLLCRVVGVNAQEKMSHTRTAAQNLVDENGYNVGKIVFLIRVSCFGYMIVTGFQLSEEDEKNFKFKNISEFSRPLDDRPSKVSQDRKGSKADSHKEPPCKDKKDSKAECKKSKDDVSKDHSIPSDRKSKTGKSPRVSCPFGFPEKPVCQCCPCQRAISMNKSSYQYRPPCGPPQGQFDQSFTSSQNQVCGYTPGQYFPGQHYAPSVGTQPSLTHEPQGTGQIRNKDVEMDPGSVAIRGNQLVFKMPDKQAEQVPAEGKFASSVYYTMGDEKQEGPRNVIQILPQNPIPATGDEPGGPNDKQDVLVLKLGKKRMAAGKKPKLELELRTPKMKKEKPETDTQYTQYLDSDIPKPQKAGNPQSAKGSKKGKKK